MHTHKLTSELWNGLQWMVTRIHEHTHTRLSHGTVWSGWLHTYIHAHLHAYMHAHTLTSESWNGLERMVTHIHARTHTHLGVVEGFGADGYAPQVDGLLEPRRDPQSLQLLVSVARQLETAQVLRLFGHRVQGGYLGSTKETVKTRTR